jgi:DNA-binding CsgD family transcriptional regulator
VRRLDAGDVSALLSFTSELKAIDDPLPFSPRLLARLNELIASKWVGYSELDPVRRQSILQVSYADGEGNVLWGSNGMVRNDLWWQLRGSHPVCGYRTRNDNWAVPLKVSDFATLPEFRRTPIYDAFYRGELDYWLDMGLPASRTRTRVFIFARRDGKDFDERDRLVLRLLYPHLVARANNAEVAARAVNALTLVEEADRGEPRRVVLCSGDGTIEFASASSRALLTRYMGIPNGRLPAAVLGRTELVLARDDRRLTVRIARTGGLYVLLLDERDMRIARLTAREREILEQVVRGAENEEIALDLGIASATVAKHLEHVYEKLGVRNRTAAAARMAATTTAR